MKIHQLLKDVPIIITNEERQFIQKFQSLIPLSSLSEHDVWTAQNLVRKGVYKLTNDSKNIILNKNHAGKNKSL